MDDRLKEGCSSRAINDRKQHQENSRDKIFKIDPLRWGLIDLDS